ncbi:MAG: hypothetical protein K8L91_19255 [Anaerolineae bacterium]|nr:hypothetical protein [Anaerolineae bacterium]
MQNRTQVQRRLNRLNVIGREQVTVSERPPLESRVSWGAILAGIAVAAVTQIALNMLGLAIGASAIDVAEGEIIGMEFETATIVWMSASILISLFVGGWVAGRLAGTADETDGALHGLTVWAVSGILSFLLLTLLLGSILNGVSNVVGRGLSLAGSTVEAFGPEVAEATDLRDSTRESIREEIRTLRNSPNEFDLTALFVSLDRLLRDDNDVRRQELIDLLVEQGGVTLEDATAAVARWEEAYRNAANNLEEVTERYADDAADTTAEAAGLSFIGMILGAFAASAGGMIGAQNQRYIVYTRNIVSTATAPGAAD